MSRTFGPFALVILAGMLFSLPVPAQYRVGVGKADITPEGPIWLAGYGSRKKPSEGVEQSLFVKALAIQHEKDPPLILITADIIGFGRGRADAIAQQIEKEHKIPRSNILLCASHTHTGPVVSDNLTGMFDLKDKDLDAVRNYAKKLHEKTLAAVADAMKNPTEAKLGFARTKASFAANRRVFRGSSVNFGVNPDGVVDHEVPVLRIDNADGTVRAIVFGYACHCTTLGGDYYRVCGDWAGYAQEYLERAHPGATAFFVTGCGGDANPEPRGKIEHARQHGLEMAGAVSQALKGTRTPMAGALAANYQHVDLPFGKPPTIEEFKKKLEDKSPFVQRHARRQIEILERDGKLPASYPCPVQVWRLGKDLSLIALGGEVVVDYALRLKRELRGKNIWVAGYSNDVFAYVPSARILIEGGYEADFNLIYYGQPTRFANTVEDVLVKGVLDAYAKAQK